MTTSDPITRLNAALEGRYRIERELGEGGMATVYLADDLRHERKVALKVLKPELAAVVGAERFLAEIKTTANLQHPHILPLFDSGEAGSFLFYVMPYVEGESLRERLDREHQLPVEEAVQIARNVAEALAYAHSKGVIHRDIKPANILLQAGKPVVSDFGIALALGVAGGGRLTETGLSLGTPHYMSPEQATGDLSVGAASDIYALGCVLYEMLVGEPPFTGSTPQAILGKIIAGELTSATKQRATVPPNVDAAIRKALEKVPADRFASPGDFARACADPGFRHGGLATATSTGGTWNRLSVTLAVTTAAMAVLASWALTRPDPPRLVERFWSPFVPGQEALSGYSLDISPDGSFVIYRPLGTELLVVRRWSDLEATLLRGTEGGEHPAISPDGSEFAFDVGDEVRVMSLESGEIRSVMPGEWPRWESDGYLYARLDGGGTFRAHATGGPVDTLVNVEEATQFHAVGDLLPDGRHAVAWVASAPGVSEIQVLHLVTGESDFVTYGTFPRYVDSGHILFRDRDAALAAVPFDPDARELLGPPVPLIEEVYFFRVSDNGSLIYRSMAERATYEFVWVTREGVATPVEPASADNPAWLSATWRLSPDGERIAVQIDGDIWIVDTGSGSRSRLTFLDTPASRPSWSPDGRSVTYVSREGESSVWSVPVDGSEEPAMIYDHASAGRPRSGNEGGIEDAFMTPDGRLVVATRGSDLISEDVLTVRLGQDSLPRVPLAGQYSERTPALSPDGQWLAYSSDETGRFEVYVRPFPSLAGPRRLVSTEGGGAPRWARDGSELFFQNPSGVLIAAELEIASDVRVVERRELFLVPSDLLSGALSPYLDTPPGDDRFLMARVVDPSGDGPMILVRGFFEELNRLVPAN